MLRIICFTFLTINIVLALDGPNTCVEEKEVPVVVKVPAKVPQETKTFKWCLSKIRCEVTKIVYVEGYKEDIHYEKNRTRVCCKGYAEARNKCIPICSSSCLHGRCISPEKCDCEPGWAGANCDITCPKGKKGKNCDQPCSCKNDAGCDAISGECICRPGWTGVDCSETCPPQHHGFRCLDECKCYNEGDCDPVTGRCKCKPGWKGQYCQIECSGSDADCIQGCYCDHGGYCNSTTGLCKCPPGYTGEYCSDQCPYGTYGLNCAHKCSCNYSDSSSEEHVVCDHISGCKIWSSASLKILDTSLESSTFGGASSSSSTTLILLIGMIIIVLLISGFLILKYRRELRLLNSELAFVTYISRKESNDRFDNPLYSYQATDYKPPLSPSGQSPPLPPPQASSSSPLSNSFLSTKAALLSGFKRDPELVVPSSSCKANEKLSGLPTDFLKPFNSPASCYEDLKTSKREYNSNIYEDGGNHCGSKFLPPPQHLPPPSPTPSTTTTIAKEPVYAEIPGSGNFNCSDNSDDEDLKENQYDVPRPINSPNNQVNNKLDNLK